MIATIRKGYTIKRGGESFLCIGSRSLRGKYFYIVRDVHGKQWSMRREDVLQGQRDGMVTVTA